MFSRTSKKFDRADIEKTVILDKSSLIKHLDFFGGVSGKSASEEKSGNVLHRLRLDDGGDIVKGIILWQG